MDKDTVTTTRYEVTGRSHWFAKVTDSQERLELTLGGYELNLSLADAEVLCEFLGEILADRGVR